MAPPGHVRRGGGQFPEEQSKQRGDICQTIFDAPLGERSKKVGLLSQPTYVLYSQIPQIFPWSCL